MVSSEMFEKPLIFLSYARQDQTRIDEYYQHLTSKGLTVWMDKYQIKGGQNWDFETRKALKKADIVVVFLSENSINHRGYVQREIKLALKQYEIKLIDDIYIIPIALDADSQIPEQLEDIHVIKAAEVDSFVELTDAISSQFDEMDVVHQAVSEQTGIKWHKEKLEEVWEGLPGYEFSAEIVRFSSNQNADLSKITDILRGWVTQQLLNERHEKFDQTPLVFNFGQEKYRRQNSWEAYCGDPIIVNKVLSLIYTVWWYGAGAAHPNSGFHAFNFITDPLLQIGGLDSVFVSEKCMDALAVIQDSVREQAMSEEERSEMVLRETLISGTEDWECFENYGFTPEGLMILIPPYQIAPYAAGSFHALIDYKVIKPLMKPEYIDALGIQYIDASPFPFAHDEAAKNSPLAVKPTHAAHLAKNAPHLILPYEDDGEEGRTP